MRIIFRATFVALLFLSVGLKAQMPTPPTAITPTNTQNHQTTIQPLVATPITVTSTGVVSTTEVSNINTAIGTNIANCNRAVTYLNDLGQAVESINIGTVSNISPITPATADNTVVKIVTNDGHYRPKTDLLPFATGISSTNDDFIAPATATTTATNYYPNTNNTIANDNGIPNGSITYEASPLDRLKNVFKPGNATQSVSYGYVLNNTITDGTIKNWKFSESALTISSPTTYGGNELYKNTSTDEDGHTVHEFYNRRGQLILHRVFLSTANLLSNCADTYYMYNDFGNVNCIATPLAVSNGMSGMAVTDLFYYYLYDARQRLIAKKIPGKSQERYVYNKLNKVALRQDGVLTGLGQWEFTKYDHLGRAIMTGIFASAATQATLQSNFDAALQSFETRSTTTATSISDIGYTNNSLPSISSITSINTLYYYDTYANIRACLSANSTAIDPSSDIAMASGITPITFSTITIGSSNGAVTVNTTTALDNYKFAGQLMAVRRRVFKPTGSTAWNEMGEWNNTLYFYDRYGRPTIETNYLPTGGKTVTHRTYRFDGQVDIEVSKQQLLSSSTATTDVNRVYWIKKTNTYDNDGRLSSYALAPTFTTGIGTAPTFPTAQEAAVYQYNELGQLSMKRLHTVTAGSVYWQNIDYLYNIRGELTAINKVDDACPPPTFEAPPTPDPTQPTHEDAKLATQNPLSQRGQGDLTDTPTTENDNIPYECATDIAPDSSYNCLINYPFTTDSLIAIAENLPNYMQYDPAALVPLTKRFEGTTITTVQVLQLLQGAINQPLTARWRWCHRDRAYENGLDTINLSRFKLLYQQLQEAVLAHAAQQCQQTPPPALANNTQTDTDTPTQTNATNKQADTNSTPQTPEAPQPPQPPLPPPPTTITTDLNDLFAMGLYYNGYNTANDLGGISNTPAFNGNIAATKWRMGTTASCQKHVYAYTYDAADRLTNALYAQQTGAGTNTNLNRFDETATYNRNGDILTLNRKGSITGGSFGTMDNLTYTYNTTGILSQLQKIAETGDNTQGFTDLNPTATTPDYTYDTNGNQLTDQNKNISIAYYPTLNQPQKVTKATDKIEWLYDATGNKIAKATVIGATTDKQYYLNGFEYNNKFFRTIYHPEGRITNTSATPGTTTTLRHEYYLRDHLGNPRILFTDANNNGAIAANDILQTNTYYPYGSTISTLSSGTPTVPNDYKYNNKEFIDDLGLNMLDYGSRLYDPLTARWNGVDALAEKYHSTTGYGYVAGNPVKFIDRDGRDFGTYVDEANSTITIKAMYYTDNNQDVFDFVTNAVTYFNSKNGQYQFQTKKKNYDIIFDFQVAPLSQDPNAAQLNEKLAAANNEANYVSKGQSFPLDAHFFDNGSSGIFGTTQRGDVITLSNSEWVNPNVLAHWKLTDENLNAFMQQVYIHEIFHSLGLSHSILGTNGGSVNQRTIGAILKYASFTDSSDRDPFHISGTAIKHTLQGVKKITSGDLPQTKIYWQNSKPRNLKGEIILKK